MGILKRKKDIAKDMQADNIYVLDMLEATDWQAAKNIDMLFKALLESPNQNITIAQLIAKMVQGGLDIDAAKETLAHRDSLRDRIVGKKDVEGLKKEYLNKKTRYQEVELKIDFYKKTLRKIKKMPYPELEFKAYESEFKDLKEWLLDNKWIANHEMR